MELMNLAWKEALCAWATVTPVITWLTLRVAPVLVMAHPPLVIYCEAVPESTKQPVEYVTPENNLVGIAAVQDAAPPLYW